MTFQRDEQIYVRLVRSFLLEHKPVDDFIRDYLSQWRSDRDAEWNALSGSALADLQPSPFNEVVDRAFTACDCFSHNPSNEFEISEVQLRAELQGLFGSALGAESAP